ncbi:MAG: HlyD family efflux transporter periplasmic adaptor subunit [Kiritimatiellae bacterium]|jgi:HlyD family secretion protein|nr:HlyD family efflux transporter periplasmic adaptor subunit [Kiritimatiellia bacterium]
MNRQPHTFNSLIRSGLLGALLMVGASCSDQVKEEMPTSEPTGATSRSVIRETGVLEAKELAQVLLPVKGVITEVVEDGVPVQKGDVLLRLDDEELRSTLEEEQTSLDQRKEDLETEKSEYRVLTDSFEINSRLKQAELEHARLELAEALISLTPGETRLHEIDIELATLDLADKREQLLRQTELVEKEFAPETTLNVAIREKEAAITFLEEKKSQFEIASQPLVDEERLTLETAVRIAEDAVIRNEQRQERDLNIQELKIEGIELKIAHLIQKIERIESEIAQVVIHAPTSGIARLTRKYAWSVRSWLPISTGQELYEFDVAATIVDPSDLSLRLMVHETDAPSIQIGQAVEATLVAFPDETITGTVTSITEAGQDRDDLSPIFRQSPPISQALFLVRVDLERVPEGVMPGMTANVEIDVDSLPPSLEASRE